MGKNVSKMNMRRKTDKKPVHPIVVFLAFLVGTAAAFAAFWRIRSSKQKKSADASVGTTDSGSAQAEKELRALVKELREENERRIEEMPKVTAYVPRKRVSVKKIFGRATAVAVAAALVVTGLYVVPGRMSAPEVLAKERQSLGGIGQVVQEHNAEPFVILDIVPGTAHVTLANGGTYDFSLGTIGYYAPGQSPVQKDLARIFEGEGKENLYTFKARNDLVDPVINAFSGLSYREAYAGTEKNQNLTGWTQIFAQKEFALEWNADGTVKLPAVGTVPTGRLVAGVTKLGEGQTNTSGFDYELGENNGLFEDSGRSVLSLNGIYTLKTAAGDYHVIFGDSTMATKGYRLERRSENFADYPETTGVYRVEDGKYRYIGMIKDVRDSLPTEPQAENSEPEDAGESKTDKPDSDKPKPNPDDPTPTPGPDDPTPTPNPDDPTPTPNPDDPTPTPGPDDPTPTPGPDDPTPIPSPDEPTSGPEDPTPTPVPDDPTPTPGPDDPTPVPGPEEPTPAPGPDDPAQTPGPEGPAEPQPEEPAAAEPVQNEPVASAFRTQAVRKTVGGWYLLVSTGDPILLASADADPNPNESGNQTPTSNPDEGGNQTPTPNPEEGGEPTPTPTPNPEEGGEPTPTPNPEEGGEPTPAPNPDEGGEPTPTPNPDEGGEPTPTPNPEEGGNQTPTPTPNPDGDQTANPEQTPVQQEMPPDGTYWVLEFAYAETEQEEFLYQVCEVNPVLADSAAPWDSYVLEGGLPDNLGTYGEATAEDAAGEADLKGKFLYVGPGQGSYKIERDKKKEYIAAMTGGVQQGEEMQDADDQQMQEYAQSSAIVGYGLVEVQNAPVYMRCTGGKDWLRQYVFNTHPGQDNASNNFTVQVNTVLAQDVEPGMIQEADLVYLEDGKGPNFENKSYIYTETKGNVDDGLGDISKEVIQSLLYGAVEESKPVIVDYGAAQGEDYPGSYYQSLAKAFLKKDLAAFYHEMGKTGNLADNIWMNVNKDSKEYPDKTDNGYHYVNRNVYVVNGLVGDDFPNEMEKSEASAGFSEVLAAIRAENALLSEDERISENISKAMAVQYIINYSLGLVGEYKDLSILELQPTANTDSDLHRDADVEKGRVVLYWQKDKDGEGQQILRSSKLIETNVRISSVAAFNSSYQDINADYNMIFIGLDGQRLYREKDSEENGGNRHRFSGPQRLYREKDSEGKLSTVYNDGNLNGTVYHTGDRVGGGGDARYDANDITQRKKEALLDYLRAGYPIVVENDCFKGKSAQKAEEKDINTDYIARDTQMYDFLKKAISMGRSDQDGEYRETGIGIYTIEDVHSSAMFAVQLNALRPKVSLYVENTEGGEDSEVASDMIATQSVPDMAGITRGTFEYRIASDRMGEDKTYRGNLDRHLYLDLNYDGYFAPEEEIDTYQHEQSENGGKISVDFNEINFGIVPWKLEVTDAENRYRRGAVQGCFTISGREAAKIRVLQVLDSTAAKEDEMAGNEANLQNQYESVENSLLAHYLRGAESRLQMNWKFETVTPAELALRLSKNADYLSRWDVIVLGFGESGEPVATEINDFIDKGGSVVVSSAGASTDKGRLGLSAAVLGQEEGQTYGKLGSLFRDIKYRYDGIRADMFDKKADLLAQRINEGAITRWPYPIEEAPSLNGTEVSMPDYLLDIGTTQDEGKPNATAWFTLMNDDYEGGYSVSPRDGRNNYYLYSKGNVVYVGQSSYPYTYDRSSGETLEGAGINESMIFVNALLAAYNGGVHRADVSIVAGFNGAAKVESVTIPFDVAFKEGGDTKGGILGDMVDVYFRFTDNNIAVDKTTTTTFYYKNASAAADAALLLPDGGINENDYTNFTDRTPIWTVENNRLVEVTDGRIVPGKVYRIKAPLDAMQAGDDAQSQICVLITNNYTRAKKDVQAFSMDSVSLNRAQMFLLE